MNRNRDHANRPTRLTDADRARQARAVAAHDARILRNRRRERIAAFIVTAGGAVALVAVFISATGGI